MPALRPLIPCAVAGRVINTPVSKLDRKSQVSTPTAQCLPNREGGWPSGTYQTPFQDCLAVSTEWKDFLWSLKQEKLKEDNQCFHLNFVFICITWQSAGARVTGCGQTGAKLIVTPLRWYTVTQWTATAQPCQIRVWLNFSVIHFYWSPCCTVQLHSNTDRND